jgi:hypothetical protein
VTFQLISTSGAAARPAAPRTVERVSVARLPTETGEFHIAGYRSKMSDEEFVALYKGELNELF